MGESTKRESLHEASLSGDEHFLSRSRPPIVHGAVAALRCRQSEPSLACFESHSRQTLQCAANTNMVRECFCNHTC